MNPIGCPETSAQNYHSTLQNISESRSVVFTLFIVRSVRYSTDTDWGVCNWPWYLFALGKADRPLFVTVFCACELIQLFSVVFCMLRAVHKFDFGLVTKRKGHAVTENRIFDRIYRFSPRPSSRVLRDSTHAVQVNCILLSKYHYLQLLRPQISGVNRFVRISFLIRNIPKAEPGELSLYTE